MARLEHVNLTVADPDMTAKTLCGLFDWTVRWSGPALGTGRAVHVGDEASYLALYSPGAVTPLAMDSHRTQGAMNHVAVVVDDLDAVEDRVRVAGFHPAHHANYEPGRRFYFVESNGVEIEVVSYRKG